MGINSQHPKYSERASDWRQMRHTYAGQRVVKENRYVYLPPTGGMVIDGVYKNNEKGLAAYNAYLARAVFPELVKDATQTLVGVMHRKPATIELPPQLEGMRKRATRKGESLDALLRKINEEQLLTGRFGLLADAPPVGPVPHIVTYTAESIINWDDEVREGPEGEFDASRLNFLVLSEDAQVRSDTGFEWRFQQRFRVCQLVIPSGTNSADAVYATYTERDDIQGPTVIPAIAGRSVSDIPFVMVGANDLALDPDDIPLLGLANLALTIYRGEADFRQTLFMLGQDTLVISGEVNPDGTDGLDRVTRTGAGAKINVDINGKAEYIGVNSDGLPEQRRALESDYTRAREAGSRLLEPRSGQAESGEALKVRVGAQTAGLNQIAKTGAAGLEQILRTCALWVGADPDLVIVRPNLDFSEANEKPQSLVFLMDSKAKGAPISFKSIHHWAQENSLTQMEYEEELAVMAAEKQLEDTLRASRESAGAKPPQAPTGPGGPPDADAEDDAAEDDEAE